MNLPKFIKSIDYEYTGDKEYIDFTVIFDKKLFNELNINSTYYENDYLINELGTFYLTDNNTCWFWVILDNPIKIPELDKGRKELGSFKLYDSESVSKLPDIPYLQKLKEALTPFLTEKMIKAINECYYEEI